MPAKKKNLEEVVLWISRFVFKRSEFWKQLSKCIPEYCFKEKLHCLATTKWISCFSAVKKKIMPWVSGSCQNVRHAWISVASTTNQKIAKNTNIEILKKYNSYWEISIPYGLGLIWHFYLNISFPGKKIFCKFAQNIKPISWFANQNCYLQKDLTDTLWLWAFSHESRFEIAMANCNSDIWITQCTHERKDFAKCAV